MRAFLTKTICFSIPVLLIVALVNYFGDAARIFDSSYERSIARIISKGKNVTDYGNCDERILQKEMISNWTTSPDLTIIGSSRTMPINSEHFPAQPLFNNSVSSARINDMIAIYQLYKDNDAIPKRIILGIDALMFNDNNKEERWQSIASSYYKFKNIDYNGGATSYKYKQLLSFSYFQNSIDFLKQKAKGVRPKETDIIFNTTKTKLSDGSTVMGETIRDIAPSELETKVNSFLSNEIKRYDGFDSISESIWQDFELLIFDMKESNIKIELILPPYHPNIYNEFNLRYQSVLDVENKIIRFARKKDILVHGSFNPSVNQLNETHFYDAIHPNEKGIRKLMQAGM